MSADEIFLRICSLESCSLMRKSTSVLHFKNSPKYSWMCFQYLSESELAVGIKRNMGCFFLARRIISRSMGAVPLVSDFPATNCNDHLGHAFILALNLLPHSIQLRGFCEDDGQTGRNRITSCLPTTRQVVQTSRPWGASLEPLF